MKIVAIEEINGRLMVEIDAPRGEGCCQILTHEDRLALTADSTWEDQLTAAIDREGICISVSQEQAVDSYNRTFECQIHLAPDQAITLAHWLIRAVDARRTVTCLRENTTADEASC